MKRRSTLIDRARLSRLVFPVPAKSRPGATPAPVAIQRRRVRVKFVTRLGVSSSLAPNVRPRRPAFLCSGSARLIGGPFQPSFTPCFRCRGEPSVLASVLQAASPRSSRPFHLKYAALPQAGSYVPYDNWVSSLEAVPHGSRASGARRAPHRAEQTSSIQKTRRVLGDAGSAEPLERRSGSFDTASSSARARAINGATYTPGKPRRPRRRLDQKSRVS